VADVVAPDAKDLSDGPRALKELLRIGAPSDPPAARPRVIPQSAIVDDQGRWVVEATVRVKPDTISDGKPVVVFQAETGGGQQVRWATLEAVKGCTQEDSRLEVAKGAREFRFRGVTDPKSHPVPAETSTIVIDFRDVHQVKKAVNS
jgi:RNA polymerase primary sigma factor